MLSPTPAKLSKRDARYINLWEGPVGKELLRKFGSSKGFSIAEASDTLDSVAFLHYSTRYDVVGAVARFLLYSEVLERDGKKFRYRRQVKKLQRKRASE